MNNNKPINLILHTSGGQVFHSILISKMLKNYKGIINVYVPSYAMSGGSLLFFSGDNFYFNPSSCIGTIDPQVGDLFNFGSASSWNEVFRIKKSKLFALMMKTINL